MSGLITALRLLAASQVMLLACVLSMAASAARLRGAGVTLAVCWSVGVKYGVITSATVLVTSGGYDIVKRIVWLRPFFGLKPIGVTSQIDVGAWILARCDETNVIPRMAVCTDHVQLCTPWGVATAQSLVLLRSSRSATSR